MLSKILSGAAGGAAPRWICPGAGTAATPEIDQPPDVDLTGEPHDTAAHRLAEFEQLAETRCRQARQAGFREGETAGRTQAQAQLEPVLEKLAAAIAEISALRPRLMREAEADLVELSIGIARRILRREISVDPDALEGLVQAALQKLPSQEIGRLRTHPALENGIRQALAKAGRGSLPVVADQTLPPGAIYLETARGKLDASLETQLAEIGRGLADRAAGK